MSRRNASLFDAMLDIASLLPWQASLIIRCLTPHHLQIAPHCVADSRHAVFLVWCGDVISSLQILNRFSKQT